MQAGVDSNDTLLLKDVWRAWTPELAGLFGTWRTAVTVLVVALASARSAPPRQQPAGDPHARPDLAREVLLAQPDLAALAPRELGGRLRLGHGLCPGRSRLGFGSPPRAGPAREQHAWRGRIDADAPVSADPEPLVGAQDPGEPLDEGHHPPGVHVDSRVAHREAVG